MMYVATSTCRDTGVAFLDGMTPEDTSRKLDEGVLFSSGGPDGKTAETARAHAGRTMPV